MVVCRPSTLVSALLPHSQHPTSHSPFFDLLQRVLHLFPPCASRPPAQGTVSLFLSLFFSPVVPFSPPPPLSRAFSPDFSRVFQDSSLFFLSFSPSRSSRSLAAERDFLPPIPPPMRGPFLKADSRRSWPMRMMPSRAVSRDFFSFIGETRVHLFLGRRGKPWLAIGRAFDSCANRQNSGKILFGIVDSIFYCQRLLSILSCKYVRWI